MGLGKLGKGRKEKVQRGKVSVIKGAENGEKNMEELAKRGRQGNVQE